MLQQAPSRSEGVLCRPVCFGVEEEKTKKSLESPKGRLSGLHQVETESCKEATDDSTKETTDEGTDNPSHIRVLTLLHGGDTDWASLEHLCGLLWPNVRGCHDATVIIPTCTASSACDNWCCLLTRFDA